MFTALIYKRAYLSQESPLIIKCWVLGCGRRRLDGFVDTQETGPCPRGKLWITTQGDGTRTKGSTQLCITQMRELGGEDSQCTRNKRGRR